MGTRRNVFIVGAGASKEVNFPIGDELKEEIASALSLDPRSPAGEWHIQDEILSDTLKAQGIRSAGTPQDNHMTACAKISLGMNLNDSIDRFLNTHSSNLWVQKCGKLTIAKLILEYEQLKFPHGNRVDAETMPDFKALESSWLTSVFKILGTDPIESVVERLRNLSFVIFNYDRAVEHYLYWALRVNHGIGPKEAASLINEVEFIHPYGQLGSLPWQDKKNSIAFDNQGNRNDFIAAAEQIKTFNESLDEGIASTIRERVRQADTLFFLGFGFVDINMELITPLEPSNKHAHIFATSYLRSTSDGLEIKRMLESFRGRSTAEVQKAKCGELIRNYSIRISRSLKH